MDLGFYRKKWIAWRSRAYCIAFNSYIIIIFIIIKYLFCKNKCIDKCCVYHSANLQICTFFKKMQQEKSLKGEIDYAQGQNVLLLALKAVIKKIPTMNSIIPKIYD